MDKIILLANSKGGAGKSTVAVNIAAEMALHYPVKLIDADAQRSATLFNHNRKKARLDPLEVLHVDDDRLKKEIAGNHGIMIIDTGAFDTPAYRAAMLKADIIIAPTSSSGYDLYGLAMFLQKFQDLQKAKRKVNLYALANRIEPRSAAYAEIKAFTDENKKLIKLFKTKIHARKDFITAFDDGRGVTEYQRNQAGREVKALVKEILECLKAK